jgi:hypothetical protein
LAYSFSVYIILPEITHQHLFAAADNSPWNIFPSLKTHINIYLQQLTTLHGTFKATEV